MAVLIRDQIIADAFITLGEQFALQYSAKKPAPPVTKMVCTNILPAGKV